jgi:WD40 repeat protein
MIRPWTSYAAAPLILAAITVSTKAQPSAKVDVYGDPLPAGAIARLGTVRWRHADGALFVAILPDGKSVLSVGGDATVRIWDTATGKELRRFGTASPVNSGPGAFQFRGAAIFGLGEESSSRTIALSADGKLLAVGSTSSSVGLYDTATGKELRQVGDSVKGGSISAVALTPDGKKLVLQTMDGKYRLCETATGKVIKELGTGVDPNKPSMMSNLAITPDGKTLATVIWTGDSKSELTLWETDSGKVLSRITGKDQAPDFAGLEYSPDGKWLAWISRDQRIVLAEPGTGKEVRRLRFGFFARSFAGFTFTPDSKMVLAWEQPTGQFHLWETATAKHVRSFKAATENPEWVNDGPTSVAISQDGKLLARATAGGPISILDIAKGTELERQDAHRRPINRLQFDREGKQLVTMDDSLHLLAWEANSGKRLRSIPAPRNRAVAGLSDDGRLLVVRSARDSIGLVELATGKEIRAIATGLEGGLAPVLSPDGKQLAVAGTKGKKRVIGLYDAASGKETRRLTLPELAPPPDGAVPAPPGIVFDLEQVFMGGAVFYSPDGRVVATMLDNQRIALWDVTTGRELPIIEAPKEHAILALAFSPDGKSLAVNCDDGMPRLFETATGHERRRYETKLPAAKAGQDLEVRIAPPALGFFDMEMGNSIQPQIALPPNGRLLVHCRQGGVIVVWDLAANKELHQLKGHQAEVNTLAFSADGKTLASGSRDTTVLLWDMTKFAMGNQPQAAKLDAAARWNDLLTTDAARAFDAICAFAAAPGESVVFLKDRAHPAAAADAQKVDRLLAALDSPRFAERKQASVELEQIGEAAIPLLRKALEGDPTPEARKRIEELLRKTDSGAPRGELLRSLRVVEVLECIGTPDAKSVLKALAKGTPDASLTRSAEAALDRLGR